MATAFKMDMPRFVIRRGIPLPERTYGPGRAPVYPFADMEVGDSFDVPVSSYVGRSVKPTIETLQVTVGNCARGYAQRHNPSAKFATRQLDKRAVRVWRVA